jgi:uncharacterized protein (DUF952 family)
MSHMATEQSLPIYHLTTAGYYHSQPPDQPYLSSTFSEEGFIHCTAGAEKLIEIANIFFASLQDELLALEINPALLTSPLLYEPPIPPLHADVSTAQVTSRDQDTLFPHIYGPLDRQAIVNRFALQRDQDGLWQLPKTTTDR